MTSHSHLEITSATAPGVLRVFNEDSIAIERELGLLILADGMGGYKAGDVASSLATDLVLNELKQKSGKQTVPSLRTVNQLAESSLTVKAAIEKANRFIYKAAHASDKHRGMGTTIVAILFQDGWATIAHVGDSRLYRLRQGELTLLTHDHSLLQEQVELGMISAEEARYSHNRNLVTRALGVEEEVKVDVLEVDVWPDDIYLLCSDGLNDMVDDADIELALSELQVNLPLAANHLVEMANDNGGYDNISVVIAKLSNGGIVTHGLRDKLLGWLKSLRG